MKKIKQQKYLKMKNKTKQKNYNINQKSFYFEDYLETAMVEAVPAEACIFC